jgi:intracellular sulfur oxidation DsrE/DsrF family protein
VRRREGEPFFKEKAMNIRKSVAAFALVLTAGLAWAQDKVVYHVSDTEAQALGALRNVRNHLDTDPTARITVVTHAQGVDFLMEGAKDRNGSLYAGPVSALKSRGVNFEVCEITLKNRNLKKEQFLQEVDFTPSGVVRITKLQLQGYAYIRP